MREVTPQELREYNEQSWKETQKIFRKRLREIATSGNSQAEYCEKGYCFGERIKPWLESLGFTVKPDRRLNWYEVTWSEEEDIPKKLPEGTWQKDMEQYDYVCSACGKHAEYTTPYCPNCGKKMKSMEGRKYE